MKWAQLGAVQVQTPSLLLLAPKKPQEKAERPRERKFLSCGTCRTLKMQRLGFVLEIPELCSSSLLVSPARPAAGSLLQLSLRF